MSTSGRNVHILQMGKHFVYLPIYYAHSRNFFGHLKEPVAVVIDEPLPPYTDTATFDHVMDRSPRHRDFVMCITDPTLALQKLSTEIHRPAILATLVTNGSFWAVDHRTRTVKGLRDLGSFERIIAYKPGTTSYNIAARIARSSALQKPLGEHIRVVNQGEELGLLLHPLEGANAVALSPDILAIEEMTERNQLAIELALGETDEYSDVLVTALVSTQEFVADNPAIVSGILRAIQQALNAIRRLEPDAIRFAQSYFHYADRAEGALRKAVEAGVIPRTIVVTKGHWMRAARAFYEAENGGQPWTDSQEQAALDAYGAFVAPYSSLALEAVQAAADAQAPAPESNRVPLHTKVAISGVTGAIAVAATAVLGWVPAAALLVASLVSTLLLSLLARHGGIWPAAGLAFLTFMGAAIVALPWIPQLTLDSRRDLLVGLGGGVLFAVVTTLVQVFWKSTHDAR